MGLAKQDQQAIAPEIDLERMPSFLLNHIVHQYHQTLQSRLKSVGVSTLKMRIVISLKIYGRLTVNELCGYAIAEQPTMSRALDSLEKQKLVERQPSMEDSRLRVVSLTPAGQKVFDRIHPEILRVNAAMMTGFSDSEREAFLASLTRVLANLRQG
ncbi:MarR family winged helix-turn-helix transcriptional regulator [Paracoccus sp. S1E-3]|uniref:MarR family winged helix-turn-helix transcriptional regulator n=1 Tax=Paracoccus sp. S1E-3 TaxID=2756130 RepID=UPI0015EE6C26|nr:MarR family winged helix-turn-helix transcriptional regulator [Paracoccus sp. S1E-3]MBA4491075.1 winged helix-turn-helix transcriptional regulator [Paracoccus sp. S1E-3]